MNNVAALTALLAVPAIASAQETTLQVVQQSSGVNVEACVNPGTGFICENGSSGLTGSVSIVVDDPANPTTISISALDAVNDAPIELVYDFGFFGSVTINATVFSVQLDSLEPTPPTPIVAGAFTVPQAPFLGTLQGTFNGSGIIGGTIGMGTLDEIVMDNADLPGTLTIDPMTGDYEIEFTFSVSQTGQINGFDSTTDGTGVIVARGPAPEPADECLADVNGDGNLNGADFNAWLGAFNAGSDAADQNGDGILNGADFNAWLGNFNAGCD